MGGDDKYGSSGFETYASLDADYSVSYVHVASYAEFGADSFYGANRLNAVSYFLAVDCDRLAFFKSDRKDFRCSAGNLAQICLFGQRLFGMESLLATDAGTPEAFVDGVFELFEVGFNSVFFQEIDLIFAGSSLPSCFSLVFRTLQYFAA